ncbi:MAG: hypothetical protein ABEJ89_07610 [Haloarculaceae archaeon]
MADPLALRGRERSLLLLVLGAYLVLSVIDLLASAPRVGALADLVLGVGLLVGAGALSLRAARREAFDAVTAATLAAFLLAGAAIGYEGVSGLSDLPRVLPVEAGGSLALLVGFFLYLYRRR